MNRMSRRAALLTTAGVTGSALLGVADSAIGGPLAPLYLHWFRPTYFVGIAGKQTPPARLVSVLVALGQDIDIIAGSPEYSIRGRIEAKGDRFLVKLNGQYLSSSLQFEREVDLDEVFDARGGIFGSVLAATRCVLSRTRDCAAILEEQARTDAVGGRDEGARPKKP